MYINTYVYTMCMHVCVYVCVYLYSNVCTYMYIHTRTRRHVHVHIHVYNTHTHRYTHEPFIELDIYPYVYISTSILLFISFYNSDILYGVGCRGAAALSQRRAEVGWLWKMLLESLRTASSFALFCFCFTKRASLRTLLQNVWKPFLLKAGEKIQAVGWKKKKTAIDWRPTKNPGHGRGPFFSRPVSTPGPAKFSAQAGFKSVHEQKGLRTPWPGFHGVTLPSHPLPLWYLCGLSVLIASRASPIFTPRVWFCENLLISVDIWEK